MSFTHPQPGDTDPRDEGVRPGDRARAHNEGGANDFAGDDAPEDHATPADQRKEARQLDERGAPLNQGGATGPGAGQSAKAHGPGALAGVNFSAPFIQRPVATFLLSFAIILAGAVAYALLPVSSLPEVEYPVISVSASLPGADPETMASAVATPLERQFSRIAGVNQMTSSSSTGGTAVILQFNLNRDINGAARDVQAAINAARAQLPANLPSNPTYRKINPSDSPILILALTSDTATRAQMYDASDSILAQKIAQIQGVGQTFTGGSAKPAVRVDANPTLLNSTGIGLEALRAAIGTFNVLQPTGYINGLGNQSQRIAIGTTDELYGAAAYAPLIIATDRGPVSNAQASTGLPAASSSAVAGTSTGTTGGASTSGRNTAAGATNPNNTSGTGTASTSTGSNSTGSSAQNFANSTITAVGPANAHGIVRMRDVADVYDSVEDIHTGGLFNGKPAILVVIFKSPDANVITTVDNVLKELPRLQASIPPTIKLQVVLDRTGTIRASVADARRNLIISILLVILVVFVFLREVRSTLIPSVSVPLSLLGTFGVMYLLGYTLDNLSLMALTISTGFVVDDAIVVIENISRHLEDGMSPFEAAMTGSREIGFTVLSMSTSLIAVFIPILLMGGIVGRLFRELAVTLSVAIGVSLVVSLTTTPMLSAKFLKPHDQLKKGWFYRMGERHLARITLEYERALRWVLRHKLLTGVVFLLTLALNVYLFIVIPKGFFPQQDTGRLSGSIQGQQDTSFESMQQKLKQYVSVVEKDRAVENALGFVGGGGPGGGSANSARMYITLKPSEKRLASGDTAEVVMDRLRPKLSHVPGAHLFLQASQELNIGGRSSQAQYQYTLTADTVALLNTWTPQLEVAMKKLQELKDVNTDQQNGGLEERLIIDRSTASRLGVSALAIDSTLSDAFGQRQVSTTYRALNQYHVVMQVSDHYQNDPTDLSNIYVKSSSGAMIPLSAVAHYTTDRVPLSVAHQGLTPAATISFNLAQGVAISQAEVAINNARVQIGMPSSIIGGFAGTAQAAADSFKSEPMLILLALITVYIVLGILYESFIHPITILSTLPSAGVGALLALMLFHIELSVIAMIGIILLIGIVKKNAIMMIDFALVAEREGGKSPDEAIFEACMMRFRPIMMTTFAALLGGIPLALGRGTGSELRRPLGVAIVGGLIVSQMLTLFTTPVIYLAFDWLRGAVPRFLRFVWRWFGFGLAKPRPAPITHAPAHGD